MKVVCDWCGAPMKELAKLYLSSYIFKCTKCHHERQVVKLKKKKGD